MEVEDSFMAEARGISDIYMKIDEAAASLLSRIPLNATVLASDGHRLYLNQGSADGIERDKIYLAKVITAQVYDDDGNLVFRKWGNLGRLEVLEVNSESCEVRFISGSPRDLPGGFIMEIF